MSVDNAVKYKKNSFWGRVYFNHYERVWGGEPPEKTDSCEIRKVVFFLAPYSWLKQVLTYEFFELIPVWYLISYVVDIFVLHKLWFAWSLPADDPLEYLKAINFFLTFWLTLPFLMGLFYILIFLYQLAEDYIDELKWEMRKKRESRSQKGLGTTAIAKDMFNTIKDRVCKPVIWVEGD